MSIDKSVEIHSSSIIDKDVRIGSNSKIWQWVHISKGAKIGSQCVLGQNVFVGSDVLIGDNVRIAGKSGVIKNIKDGDTVQGPLAFNIKDFQKSYIYFKKLPHINKIISKLKK